MLSREQQLQLVAKAGRAPSPHNIQPACWRFPGAEVQLYEQTSRWLSVGDPTGRDNQISLGMAWEGMSIAASECGLALSEPVLTPCAYPPAANDRLVACGNLVPSASVDELAPWLDLRQSYRGKFATPDIQTRTSIEHCVARHSSFVTLIPYTDHDQIAKWYDEAAAEGLRSRELARELYKWMRFAPKNPDWRRDGLTADCLELSTLEAWGGAVALHPTVLRILNAMGLAKILVSEADKVVSASALVLLHAPPQLNDFAMGRAWYRLWLELACAGIAGVPMSALTDSPTYAQRLVNDYRLPHRLINCMRLGIAPAQIARSTRLPPGECLL